jgi:Concanavalin A-like lectin/glucanases superfamily
MCGDQTTRDDAYNRPMRRTLVLVTLAATGCSFDPSGIGGGSGATDARADAPTEIDARPGPPDGPVPINAPPCDDQSKDLIACYRFDDGDKADQEPKDGSSYGNDGSSTGTSLVASKPGLGMALAFSPTASALVQDDPSLDVPTLTIELWLDARSLPPLGGRAGLLDENGEYGLFLAPDGGIRCSIGSATDIGLKVPAGVWTHVACTYDGSIVRLYQDGVPGPTLNTMVVIPTAPIDGLALGQNLPSGDHLDGALDDVRVWRVARTRAQVCADAGLTCP